MATWRSFEQDGKQVPGVAPTAMQQGRYAAQLIGPGFSDDKTSRFITGTRAASPLSGATRRWRRSGRCIFRASAWFIWLFIHLLYIVEFENRMLILFQWAYDYFTHNRGARLITGEWDREA